jgi:hypothetical protein
MELFDSAAYGVGGEFSAASVTQDANLKDVIDLISEFSANLNSNVVFGVSALHRPTQREGASNRLQSLILY